MKTKAHSVHSLRSPQPEFSLASQMFIAASVLASEEKASRTLFS